MSKVVVIGMAVLAMGLVGVSSALAGYQQGPSQDAACESGDPDMSNGNGDRKRMYPEVYAPGGDDKGVRPSFFQWDLTSIPSSAVITSATMHIYLDKENPVSVWDYTVSRLLPGKDWMESPEPYVWPTANPGELTWNSQKHGSVLWDEGGAGGAGDVDKTDVKYFDAIMEGEDLQIAIDIQSFVTKWVNDGTENNGVVIRGGEIPGQVWGGQRWVLGHSENVEEIQRPYLNVQWTPEPATVLLMVLGLVPMMRRRRG